MIDDDEWVSYSQWGMFHTETNEREPTPTR
jgi:hypothetical protein